MENSLTLKHIVYLTVNTVNGKFYIGVHQTETPYKFDGYLGCGAWIDKPKSYNLGKTPLHLAILKHGTHSFKRITLCVFNSREDALKLEKLIVNKEFISSSNNYNATVGGGDPPLLNKPINQFDINGKFIKTWESSASINREFDTHILMQNIIRDKRIFANSYWTYSDVKEIDVSEYTFNFKGGFINLYDGEGNFIATYKSANIAAQKLDINYNRLHSAIFRQKKCGGCYFLKQGIDIATVISPKFKRTLNKQPIYKYAITGEFLKAYPTHVAAKRDVNIPTTFSLKDAVVNGRVVANCYWSYIKSDNYFNIIDPKKYIEKPSIEQFDLDGNFIKVWDNYKECKKEFPYCVDVCNGKCYSTKGFVFKYKAKDIV